MFGTGFFPTEKSNIYALEQDGLFLTGTSEVALAAMHMTEILESSDLPLRYAGFSTCFRREAGAAGKDTRGMFRVHQFNKVEMFVFSTPDEAWAEHDRMVALEEEPAAPARAALPRRQRRRRRSRRPGGEEVRHRGLVPVPGALPRGHLLLEHDRLPGPSPWDQVPGRERTRDAAYAQRHRRHRSRCSSRSSRTSRVACRRCCGLTVRRRPSRTDALVLPGRRRAAAAAPPCSPASSPATRLRRRRAHRAQRRRRSGSPSRR